MRSPASTTQPEFRRKLIMTTVIAKRLVLAAALVAATVGAHAAGLSGARDPYTDGARSLSDTRDRYTDGARTLAGMDRTGVSSEPAHRVDPFLDGAYA